MTAHSPSPAPSRTLSTPEYFTWARKKWPLLTRQGAQLSFQELYSQQLLRTCAQASALSVLPSALIFLLSQLHKLPFPWLNFTPMCKGHCLPSLNNYVHPTLQLPLALCLDFWPPHFREGCLQRGLGGKLGVQESVPFQAPSLLWHLYLCTGDPFPCPPYKPGLSSQKAKSRSTRHCPAPSPTAQPSASATLS